MEVAVDFKSTRHDDEIYRETLVELCDLARELYNESVNRSFQLERKEDSSPVTSLDKELECALRSRIQLRHPNDSILGEEFGLTGADRPETLSKRWVIDPLDGTRAFATGSPLWGTLIGVLHDGTPWLGAVEMPVLSIRIVSTDLHQIPGDEHRCLANSRMCTTTPDKFTVSEHSAFERLRRSVLVHRYGGDCFNYAALALGRCDLVVEAGLAPHDFLPIVPIVENCGGKMTDWQGRPLNEQSSGDVIAATNATLHHEAMMVLARREVASATDSVA